METIQKMLLAAPEVVLAVVVLFGIWFVFRIYGSNQGHGGY